MALFDYLPYALQETYLRQRFVGNSYKIAQAFFQIRQSDRTLRFIPSGGFYRLNLIYGRINFHYDNKTDIVTHVNVEGARYWF